MDLFVLASRDKYRFESNKGFLTVEDLWDLSLNALNTIAKTINKELKATEEEDFIPVKTKKSNTVTANRLEIVKFIIDYKAKQQEKAAERAARQAQLERLQELAAAKADEQLATKSLDEINALIEQLKAE